MTRKLILTFLLLLMSKQLWAVGNCNGSPINPITDISWQCIFPVRLAGVIQLGPNASEDPTDTESPVCVCNQGAIPRVGVKASFWEPARIIDTVSDPYCMMPLGASITNPAPGTLGGSLSNKSSGGKAFQQMHYYQFPAWAMLDMFTDIPCIEETEFDVMMMSEVMPTWNNDVLSMIVNPESILFANPIAAITCSADAMNTITGMPNNSLFWCMGGWGNVYPLSGSITSTDYLEANAGIAARSIFLMGRLGLLKDTSPNGCYRGYTPIWKKNRYKLQMMKPVKDGACMPIGRDGMLWSGGKHAANGDNFSWMMFKKVDCCISYF